MKLCELETIALCNQASNVLYSLGVYFLNLKRLSVVFISQDNLLLPISFQACKDPF